MAMVETVRKSVAHPAGVPYTYQDVVTVSRGSHVPEECFLCCVLDIEKGHRERHCTVTCVHLVLSNQGENDDANTG